MRKLISKQLTEIADKYGADRKTVVVEPDGEEYVPPSGRKSSET